MKLYVCHKPRAVIVARDEFQAHVLLRLRLHERGVRTRRLKLTEVSLRAPNVLMPPPPSEEP